MLSKMAAGVSISSLRVLGFTCLSLLLVETAGLKGKPWLYSTYTDRLWVVVWCFEVGRRGNRCLNGRVGEGSPSGASLRAAGTGRPAVPEGDGARRTWGGQGLVEPCTPSHH